MWYPETLIGCHFGTSVAQNSNMSPMIRRCGRGGKMNSFWAMYSLRMSVWRVPPSVFQLTPWRSAAARKNAKITAAGPLMVIEVVMSPSGMSRKRTSKSASESVATPHRPTSPSERGSSESRPMSVGISKATDSPPWPCSRRYLYRALVCSAVPNPANWRIVQSLPRYMVG
jgi:hypothetical protein